MLNEPLLPRLEVIDGAIPPRRAHHGDAGLDLALQCDSEIMPGETKYIPSGVKFIVPDGLCVHVMTRSSTFKRGVVVVPTLIDSSYQGEASVIVTNTSSEPVQLRRGDCIAQAVILPYYTFANEPTPEHERHGVFGSSGSSLPESCPV